MTADCVIMNRSDQCRSDLNVVDGTYILFAK